MKHYVISPWKPGPGDSHTADDLCEHFFTNTTTHCKCHNILILQSYLHLIYCTHTESACRYLTAFGILFSGSMSLNTGGFLKKGIRNFEIQSLILKLLKNKTPDRLY